MVRLDCKMVMLESRMEMSGYMTATLASKKGRWENSLVTLGNSLGMLVNRMG